MANAKTMIYPVGEYKLEPNEIRSYFWDVPEYPGNQSCTWTVTAVPEAALDGPAHPEQRVEVTDLFLLRKGPDSAAPGPNHLQLNWNIRNVGKHTSSGRVVISAVTTTP